MREIIWSVCSGDNCLAFQGFVRSLRASGYAGDIVAWSEFQITGAENIPLDQKIEIEGDKNDADKISYYVKKGTLYIDRNFGNSQKNPVVQIAVSQLKSIEVNGRSKIVSSGFLRSGLLKVRVNEESKFDLKNMGEIIFEADNEISLQFEKTIGSKE
jgi:hypothetical protein